MKAFNRAWTLLLGLALIVAACGGGATPTEALPGAATEAPAAATEAPVAVTEAPAPTEAPAATEAPAEAKVLKLRLAADVTAMDPAFYPAVVDELAVNSVNEGLVAYKPGTWDVVNVLADSITPSADGLTVDFTLKEGVQFHGGYGEVTAEDVKFSYERIAGLTDPAIDSPYRGDWAALDNVEVTGKYTGVIHLKEPFAPLWTTTLPIGSGWILSKKAVEELGDDYPTHPIGTGPYEFVEWKPNEVVRLKRFDDYWGEPGEWDEIDFVPIVEDSAAEIALETGELDFGQISAASVDRFDANPNFTVYRAPTLDYTWLAMNVQHPNLEDVNIRQAIRYAVDVPSVIAAAYDGKYERACSLIAPGQIGYWADAPCYDRDLDKAQEYLSQAASIPDNITLTTDTSEDNRAAAEVIQANLADIGLNIEIIQQDPSAFYEGGFGEKGLTERQLVYIGYVTNPDPSWSTVWFTCEQVDEWNWMYWCNEEFDALHEAALKEPDQAKRAEMYIQMQKLWDEAVHTVWIAYPTLYYVGRAGLSPAITPHGRFVAWAFTSQ